jgi:hypothetical protein
MNWRINTSFRLLGIPHRKNNAVTRTNGTNAAGGIKRAEYCDAGLVEHGSILPFPYALREEAP